LVTNLDRLGRSAGNLEALADELQCRQVRLRTPVLGDRHGHPGRSAVPHVGAGEAAEAETQHPEMNQPDPNAGELVVDRRA